MQEERQHLLTLLNRVSPAATLEEVEQQLNKIAKQFQQYKSVMDFYTFSNEPTLARSRRTLNAERTFVNHSYARLKECKASGLSVASLRQDVQLFAKQLAASCPKDLQPQQDSDQPKSPKPEPAGFFLSKFVSKVPSDLNSPNGPDELSPEDPQKVKEAREALKEFEKPRPPMITVTQNQQGMKKSEPSDTQGVVDQENFMTESIGKDKTDSAYSPSAPHLGALDSKQSKMDGDDNSQSFVKGLEEARDPVSKHFQRRELQRRQSAVTIQPFKQNRMYSTVEPKKTKKDTNEINEESENTITEMNQSEPDNRATVPPTSALKSDLATRPISWQHVQSQSETNIQISPTTNHQIEDFQTNRDQNDPTSSLVLGDKLRILTRMGKLGLPVINSPREMGLDQSDSFSGDFMTPREIDSPAVLSRKGKPRLLNLKDMQASDNEEFMSPRSLQESLAEILAGGNYGNLSVAEALALNDSFGHFSMGKRSNQARDTLKRGVQKLDLTTLNLKTTEVVSREATERRSPFFAGGEDVTKFSFQSQPATRVRTSSMAKDLELDDQVKDLRSTNTGLQEVITGQQDRIKQLEVDLSTVKTSRDVLQRQVATLEQDNSVLKSKNLSMIQAEVQLQELLLSSRPQKVEKMNQEVIAFHKKELEHYKEMVERLNQRIGALSAENDALKLEARANHASEHGDLMGQNKRLKELNKEKEKELSALFNREAELKAEIGSLSQRLGSKERVYQEMVTRLSNENKKLVELKTMNGLSEEKISTLTQRLSDLASDFELLQRSYDLVKAKAHASLKSEDNLKSEIQQLKRRLQILESEKEILTLERKKDAHCDLEMSTMRQTLSTNELCLERQSRELFILKDQYDVLKRELKAAHESKASAASEIQDLRKQIASQKHLIEDYKAKIESLEKDNKAIDSSPLHNFSPKVRSEIRGSDLVIKETGSQWAQDARKSFISNQGLASALNSQQESHQEFSNLDFNIDHSTTSNRQKKTSSNEKPEDIPNIKIDPTAFIGDLLESIDEVIEMTNKMSENSRDQKYTQRSIDSAKETSQKEVSFVNSPRSLQPSPSLRNYGLFLKAWSTSKDHESLFKEACIQKRGVLFSNDFLSVGLVDVMVLGSHQARAKDMVFKVKLQSRAAIDTLQSSILNYSRFPLTFRPQKASQHPAT